ncbi:hypothetical protein [Pseudoruegeria sp. SK021]|uniref:hypothetical protein n=1 Tax=Pseudoruegeria sp. SK021 TaxID=1933035 RepID=UPI00111C691C|nr:hypothetical protein [Pseudoruegeria sp. SK021]
MTFDEGAGTFANVRENDGAYHGTWQEAGFEVDWSHAGHFEDELTAEYALSAVRDTPTLNDSWAGLGSSLEIHRPDGAAFSLNGIDVSQSWSSWDLFAEFTPYDADGRLDRSRTTGTGTLDVGGYNNIKFSGTKSNGDAVTAWASSYVGALYPNNDSYSKGGRLDISGELAAALSGLSSLRVEVSMGDSYQTMFRNSLVLSGVDPLFLTGFDQCGPIKSFNSREIGATCDFEKFGQFGFGGDATARWRCCTNLKWSAVPLSPDTLIPRLS